MEIINTRPTHEPYYTQKIRQINTCTNKTSKHASSRSIAHPNRFIRIHKHIVLHTDLNSFVTKWRVQKHSNLLLKFYAKGCIFVDNSFTVCIRHVVSVFLSANAHSFFYEYLQFFFFSFFREPHFCTINRRFETETFAINVDCFIQCEKCTSQPLHLRSHKNVLEQFFFSRTVEEVKKQRQANNKFQK